MCDESILLRTQPVEPDEFLDDEPNDFPEFPDYEESDFEEESDFFEETPDFMDEYLPGDEVLDGDRQIPGVTLNGAPVFETDFDEESK